MRVLIVGGTGFIGSHIVNELISKNWDISILSLHGKQHQFVCDKKLNQIVSDFRDFESLSKALDGQKFEYVINAGGYIHHHSFFNGGRGIIDQHQTGLINLVQALDRSSLKYFLNFGSSDEYGAAQAPQNEQMREAPISPYSFAKTAATQFLHMMHITENFPVVTFRIFLIYGPAQDQRRFIPQIIRGCLNNESFLASEGNQLRDFLYVGDLVKAVAILPERPQAIGEVINIASGIPVTIKEIIGKICRLTGSGNPLFGEINYRKGENMELYADIKKAFSLLGWEPLIDLEEGLIKTINYYEKNY